MRTICVLLLLNLNLAAQYDKPLKVIECTDMPVLYPTSLISKGRYTRDLGNAELLLDTAGAYCRQSITIRSSGVHRIDISARSFSQSSKGIWAAFQIRIDKANAGPPVSVPTLAQTIFSVSTNISAGTHTIDIVSLNNGAVNKYTGRLCLGLVYITKTTATKPPTLPIEPPSQLVKGQILTANHFKSKVLRGFNIGTSIDRTNQSFIEMRGTGANLARMWMNLNRPAGTDTFAFSSGALAAMDIHVALAAQKGFYVVIVLNPQPDALRQEYWGNTARAVSLRNSIKKRWQQIANRYKGKAAVAGYDLINEPRYQHYGFWINWSCQLIEAIRAIDKDHVIIVEHSYSEQMFERMIPYPYSNIVYSPHGYSPLNITHQGIEGSEILKYPLNTAAATQGVYSKENIFKSILKTKALEDRFNVPIFVGEFSCINWAPKNNAGKWSSTEWVNDKITILEAENWSWVYHAWREYEGWDAEIPSSLYERYSFVDAKPVISKSAQRAARTSAAPTITMLRNWFSLNGEIQANANKTITKVKF